MSLARVLAGIRGARSKACALGLTLLLVAAVPLAHASPPDPLWIAGIYDGADFDEVVVAVVSATGVVQTTVLFTRPTDISAREVPPHGTLLRVTAPSSQFSIRAPPSGTLVTIT